MLRTIAFAAYGWLVFTGTAHFIIDVVSQRVRGVRAPGPETDLFYGLHSSFALGQVALGALGLWLARRAPELLREAPLAAVTVLAALAWLAVALRFIEYVPPKVNAAIFVAFALALAVVARR